jgi:hypothetical protein
MVWIPAFKGIQMNQEIRLFARPSKFKMPKMKVFCHLSVQPSALGLEPSFSVTSNSPAKSTHRLLPTADQLWLNPKSN